MIRHPRDDLKMNLCTGDLVLFFRSLDGRIGGLIVLYVDDVLGARRETFYNSSIQTERIFDAKPRSYENFTFSVIEIQKTKTGTVMHQE